MAHHAAVPVGRLTPARRLRGLGTERAHRDLHWRRPDDLSAQPGARHADHVDSVGAYWRTIIPAAARGPGPGARRQRTAAEHRPAAARPVRVGRRPDGPPRVAVE